jgi:hypothetical protein
MQHTDDTASASAAEAEAVGHQDSFAAFAGECHFARFKHHL